VRGTAPLWIVLLLACASVPLVPADDAPDWSALAAENTVEIVTIDPDGDERITTIWLAVVEGTGFIRTGGSRWFANLERDPKLRMRAAGKEYPLQVEPVKDAAQAEKIDAAFREKYGASDRFISIFRGNDPNRMRLQPR